MSKFELRASSLVAEYTADDIPAAGLARFGSITSECWATEHSVSRMAVDMTGQLVDPVPPPSMLRGITTPLGDPMQSSPIMRPDCWSLDQQPAEPPSLWLLSDAHVFGGRSIGRDALGQLGGRGLLTREGSMIPASYGVADGDKEISNDLLERVDGQLVMKSVPESRYLHGTHFFIGAASDHFGHMVLEGVSRLWALDYLSADLGNSIRFLVYEDSHRKHTLDLLALAGVHQDRIVHASPHDIVERLVVPDTAMRTHRSITKLQARVWESMTSWVGPVAPYRRIYLSRRDAKDRRLRNEAEIEAYFKSVGYEILVPEKLSIGQQVKMAKEAVSLAGCVGSQMYLACFQQPGANNIVLAPRNFFLKDDVLISRSKDIGLQVVLGSKVDFRLPKAQMQWSVDLGAVMAAMNRGQLGQLIPTVSPNSI